MTGFSAINNAAYPGAWNDFVFLWADNVTKITGNHTFKAGISIERSGMNDQIQLSFAQAPATTNQNGSFRFTDTRPNATGYCGGERRSRAVRRLHRVRRQAEHEVAGDGLRLLRSGQLEADTRSHARIRSSLLDLAAVGCEEPGDVVLPVAVLRPGDGAGHRSDWRVRRQRRSLQRDDPSWRQPHRRRAGRVPAAGGLPAPLPWCAERLRRNARRTAFNLGSGWPMPSTM